MVLAVQVHLHGPAAVVAGSPESRRAGICSGLRRRSSWPVTTSPSPTASTCRWWSAPDHLPGQGRVLHRHRAQGLVPALVLHRRRPGARSTAPTPTPRRPRWPPPQRILGEGKLLGMYPEGTRSPDGRLYKGKTGLARLALETGVPVIPVAMVGTDVVNPPGSKMWRFGRVQVKFGKPMDFSRFEGLAGNRFIERAVDRRGDVRADAAVRSGVRRPVRRRRQGRRRSRPRSRQASRAVARGRRGLARRGHRCGVGGRRGVARRLARRAPPARPPRSPPAPTTRRTRRRAGATATPSVSWCSGISVIGVHTISATPAAVTAASAAFRCR